MKQFNKAMVLIVSLIMVSLIIPISVSASEDETDNILHNHMEEVIETTSGMNISPRYVASCPYGMKHQMVGRGHATVRNGSLQKPGGVAFYGVANQCRNCHLVLASEGNPRIQGITLKKYTLWGYHTTISNNGVVIFGGATGTFSGNLATDSFWRGFEFVNGF